MTSSRKQDIDVGDDEQVGVHLSTAGQAYLLPSSVRRLPGPTRRALHDLAELGAQIRHLEDHAEAAIPQLRAGGASWAQIGAALGMSGEGARSRYVVDEDLVDTEPAVERPPAARSAARTDAGRRPRTR